MSINGVHQRLPDVEEQAAGPSGAPRTTDVSDQVLDEVFHQIRALHHDAMLGLALRTAEVVIERFYGGDVEAWRSRQEADATVRLLAVRLAMAEGPGFVGPGILWMLDRYALELCRAELEQARAALRISGTSGTDPRTAGIAVHGEHAPEREPELV